MTRIDEELSLTGVIGSIEQGSGWFGWFSGLLIPVNHLLYRGIVSVENRFTMKRAVQ